MKASFGEKRHELNVSTYQMVILLLFNEADSLSYRDILGASGIPPADLKRSLQSLACVKVRPWLPYTLLPPSHPPCTLVDACALVVFIVMLCMVQQSLLQLRHVNVV